MVERADTGANLAGRLIATAAEHGERTAIRLDEIAIDYASMDAIARRVAGLLRERGVGAGDRVGVMLPNVPHFPMVYYGALMLGAIVVPMNVLLTKREVAYYLGDSGARVLIAWKDFAEAAEAGAAEAGAEAILVDPDNVGELVGKVEPVDGAAEVDGEDTAILLYTSGTTGQPKGAELTHSNICTNVDACLGLFEPADDDVFFGGLPFFHVFGQTATMNVAVTTGAEVTLLPRFDPAKAMSIVERDKVTIFMGVPTMYAAMLQCPERDSFDISSLRLCVSGGAALPVEILHEFERVFGSPIIEGYGLSETSPVASFSRVDRERRPGSIGFPIERVEMRVVDDEGEQQPTGEPGELQVRGPNVMKGYWNKPEATAAAISEDGWFSTGDVARVDEDGYFYIVDRKKEMIIRGGYNVYPREIEEAIYEHPDVAEVAVVGVPHDDLGEEIAAVIALKDGAGAEADELRAFAKERVAAYKYPRHIKLVDELPKGPTGKILKREIEVDPAQ